MARSNSLHNLEKLPHKSPEQLIANAVKEANNADFYRESTKISCYRNAAGLLKATLEFRAATISEEQRTEIERVLSIIEGAIEGTQVEAYRTQIRTELHNKYLQEVA